MSRFVWATVTDVSPLRVMLDGDVTELPFAPDSLVDPVLLVVGDRVRCEVSDRRVVIVGRSGGDVAAIAAAVATQQVGSTDDLNTYTDPGQFEVNSLSYATTAKHYPLASRAGMLLVVAGNNHFDQLYFIRDQLGGEAEEGRIYHRAKYGGGGWSAWELVNPIRRTVYGSYTTGTINAGAGATSATQSYGFTVASTSKVRINITSNSSRLTVSISSKTTTGFTIRVDNWSPSAAGATVIEWEVVEYA